LKIEKHLLFLQTERNYELGIMNYELGVMNYELGIMNYELGIRTASFIRPLLVEL
jgi:hypothetical protein